jgi:hypothetical protein
MGEHPGNLVSPKIGTGIFIIRLNMWSYVVAQGSFFPGFNIALLKKTLI